MGGGGKSQARSSGANLDKFLAEFQEQSGPARQTFFDQLNEALTTGGVGARLPIIQKSVEASKSATSAARVATTESLAKAGIGGTPFGQQILAGQELQGNLATAQIPTNIIQQLIAQAPGAVLGSAQTLSGGFGQAAQVGAQRAGQDQQLFASLFATAAGP